MSLRAKLLVGLMALVTAGLGASGVGTYLALRSFLVRRLDEQLTATLRPVTRVLAPGPETVTTELLDDRALRDAAGPGVYIEVRDASGKVVSVVQSGPHDATKGAPQLPTILRVWSAPERGVGPGRPPPPPPPPPAARRFTVPAVAGGGRFRVSVGPLPGAAGEVVVAIGLRPLDQTLRHLVDVELAISAAVLATTALLGLALARQAARPLEHIAATADAIAAGDLGRRVEGAAPSSEVGRVGMALNTMMSQIQDSFARRDETETRLRRFVADASHELSTPLTSIQGYAELLELGPSLGPADVVVATGRIRSEAMRMAGLVDDLLLLAAMDDGRPLRMELVDLALLATDAAVDIRVSDPRRAVACEAAGQVMVRGDDDRLRQVAANLTTNARRHTPVDTQIVIRAFAEGRFGVLEVVDHGPGLTSEQASRVFDRFYRVDTARARAQGGSGLGLAIVAAVIEAHRGCVVARDTPGGGATFRIEVPLI
ncbi:MAG: HAMP domain-containing sensor histidine kinase [Acidimicrobiales bacterium]